MFLSLIAYYIVFGKYTIRIINRDEEKLLFQPSAPPSYESINKPT